METNNFFQKMINSEPKIIFKNNLSNKLFERGKKLKIFERLILIALCCMIIISGYFIYSHNQSLFNIKIERYAFQETAQFYETSSFNLNFLYISIKLSLTLAFISTLLIIIWDKSKFLKYSVEKV